jgi:hypothetical protein
MNPEITRFYTVVVQPGDRLYVLFSGGPWHEITRRNVFDRHIVPALAMHTSRRAQWPIQEEMHYSWPINREPEQIKGDM